MPDVERFDGRTVQFRDGRSAEYDLVMLATGGYTLDYPFVDRAHLNWVTASPTLYLNVFPPSFNGLFVLGMIEASGIGWQGGRAEQAELVAAYLSAVRSAPASAEAFRKRADAPPWPDLTGGYTYLGLDRMSYYVNKDAYRRVVKKLSRTLPALPAAAAAASVDSAPSAATAPEGTRA